MQAADPAVRDLFGAMAYGQLVAFSQLAGEARKAPTLREGLALSRLAASELANAELLLQRLEELGFAPEEAMEPFVGPVDAFHERTAPADWAESLVKAYVGEGIAVDFFREISAYVDADSRELVQRVATGTARTEFVVGAVRAAIDRDPRLAGRLALWGRRLMGEALNQAQRVAADRDALASLLVGDGLRPGADLVEVSRMLTRITEAHTRRMDALGLAP
ncbi:tRNA-(MS[2]IO[6]A)-hydroxylase MiaE-like protein [Kineococcus xinjiangensis]|uniref:tRNA-(MS[2]IO[6]A)-hydroxylase MiaE-like protein n=1 Tax=Kineococcus xinjiangensis TaxID=512762 RepID=A0A2S6IX11_9ACTN|nr:tRNA-(MS[2]IO[6]A)-hydroxylase MiaE-like protein [Kineococcus xinjiangensis]